jgi:hypothetical protein
MFFACGALFTSYTIENVYSIHLQAPQAPFRFREQKLFVLVCRTFSPPPLPQAGFIEPFAGASMISTEEEKKRWVGVFEMYVLKASSQNSSENTRHSTTFGTSFAFN